MDAEDNATLAALQRYRARGCDLTRPMTIDFFVKVPSEAAGIHVAAKCEPLGFTTSVRRNRAMEGWTVTCTKSVIPSFETVRGIERQLDAIGRQHDGLADGFGSFGNVEVS